MKKKILIVEDEVLIREMLREIMLTEFDEVYVAGNGEKGIESVIKTEPDLVITDIKMPVMDGLTMIRKIKAFRPGQEFIILSAYSDEYHLSTASELGVKDFLTKPIDSHELIKRALALLGK
jgi:two-component system, response regulator YesN